MTLTPLYYTVQDDATNSMLDEMLNRTMTVMSSQCDSQDRCQCVVEAPAPCAYDVEYAELVRLEARLEKINGKLLL